MGERKMEDIDWKSLGLYEKHFDWSPFELSPEALQVAKEQRAARDAATLARREERKAATVARNAKKRAEWEATRKPTLVKMTHTIRQMFETPDLKVCTRCLTHNPVADMKSPGRCKRCYNKHHRERWLIRQGKEAVRAKLSDDELRARAAARQKAKQKTGWNVQEVAAYKVATREMVKLTKSYLFAKPKKYWSRKDWGGKGFDTEFERDEYVRGWREYREWLAENKESLRAAARVRANARGVAKDMAAAGCSTAEEYEAWKAERRAVRVHPMKKSEEHRRETRRIRNQWRNYRNQIKKGMSANGGRIPRGWMATQLEAQGGCCAICREALGETWEIDHIIPVALGGYNEAWNLQITHPVCNIVKSDNIIFNGEVIKA
jgi:hypothetical protein